MRPPYPVQARHVLIPDRCEYIHVGWNLESLQAPPSLADEVEEQYLLSTIAVDIHDLNRSAALRSREESIGSV